MKGHVFRGDNLGDQVNDTAVAQGSETWENRTGDPKRGTYVWTDTWILRNGKWQIVAAEDVTLHSTKN